MSTSEESAVLLPREDKWSKSSRICFPKALIAVGVVAIVGVASICGIYFEWGGSSSPPTEESTLLFRQSDTQYRSPTGVYRNAAAATDHYQCSDIASHVMRELSGSVVDAAIAALLCDGVHNAHSMGIGGGFLMTVFARERNGSDMVAMAINARETAPGAATGDMYNHGESSLKGGLSIAVPGDIAGLYEAWTRFGLLPWKSLFEPAIDLCRNGYKLSRPLAEEITPAIDDSLRPVYLKEDGGLHEPGDILYRPQLADTLEIIADKGPDAFYKGELTETIVNEIQGFGGIITAADLHSYRVKVTRPEITRLFEGYSMLTPHLPSSGILLQFMLNVFAEIGLNSTWLDTLDDSINAYHAIIETYKFAYALRTELGDEDYVDVTDIVKNLTSREFAKYIASRIDLERTHDLSYYGYRFVPPEAKGTAHLSFVAADGSAVSVTSTVNAEFGSGRRGETTGIIYNDEMDDFSFKGGSQQNISLLPSEANSIMPGKRPLSSMTPAIVLDENYQVILVTGAAGGTKITTTTAFVMAQYFMMGRSLPDAIDVPRFHFKPADNILQYEETVESEIVQGLKNKGHVMSRVASIAVCQGIAVTHSEAGRIITASSDHRKDSGTPSGY